MSPVVSASRIASIVSCILDGVRDEYGAGSQFRHAERVSLKLGRVYEFR